MLKSDLLKLNIIKLLKENEMSLGQLKKATKAAHHYTLKNALEFLQKIDLIEITKKGDKLNTHIVRIKSRIE